MGRFQAFIGCTFWASFEIINSPKRKARMYVFLNAGGMVLEAAARQSNVL